MPITWSPFVDMVQRYQSFLLTTHVRPDGDGLGSMLALRNALVDMGKTAHMLVASVLPPRYDFMDPDRLVKRFHLPGEEFRSAEAIIVLDTGTWNQLGEFGTFIKQMPVPRAVIDHHPTQDDLGATRFVDTTAEATGRLVYEAIQALGAKLSADTAHGLFIAIAMDTGWFRHNNTTPATFTLAAKLVEAGARPTAAYEMLFEQNTPGRLILTGLVLGRLTVCHHGKICHAELRKADYEATGAVPQDSEDLINYTRSVAGVEVGLFFMEQPRGGIKVSFRSRQQVNVGKVAEMFGGGGHRLASGAVLEMSLEEAKARVLAAVSAELDRS
jgi:phosphoesterase RecJ-like protein